MTRILSIDPSSNRIATSTTGVVLLDNASIVESFSIPYGVKNFIDWWSDVGHTLNWDYAVVEKYEARDSDYSRDNSVKETIKGIQQCIPEIIEQRNAGYAQDVPDALLKKLGMWRFNDKTHHQDCRAAARLGLFWAMRNDIEDVVTDIGLRLQEALCEN